MFFEPSRCQGVTENLDLGVMLKILPKQRYRTFMFASDGIRIYTKISFSLKVVVVVVVVRKTALYQKSLKDIT